DIRSYFQSDAGGQFGSVISPISGYTGAAYFLKRPARPSFFSSGGRSNGRSGSMPRVRRTSRPRMYRISCNSGGASQESSWRPKRRAYFSVRSFVSAIRVAPASAYRLSEKGWRMLHALPPGRVWASRILTSGPACVSSKPAESPASPAPMTMTLFAGPRRFNCPGNDKALGGNNATAAVVIAVQARKSLRATLTAIFPCGTGSKTSYLAPYYDVRRSLVTAPAEDVPGTLRGPGGRTTLPTLRESSRSHRPGRCDRRRP